MPIFRADYDIKASMVLPDDAKPLLLEVDGEHPFYIKLKNSPKNGAQFVSLLQAEVIGPCDGIEKVATAFREILSDQLDILCFVTHVKFSIEQCRRVVDWEPNQRSRRFLAFQKFDPHDPPNPSFHAECASTAQAIIRANVPQYVSRSFHAFRYGVIAQHIEEQFQQFWFAIEIIAEGSKDGKRVPIPCPSCNGALHCPVCGATPERRPVAAEAIRSLIEKITGAAAKDVYRRLNTTRNQLLHGRQVSSIEKELGVPLSLIVDEAGRVAWHAIAGLLPKDAGPYFSERNGIFSNGQLIAGPTGIFEYKGESEHPAEEQIPSITISLDTRFGPMPENAQDR